MVFDVTSFIKHINGQSEVYMMSILNELTVNNPGWVDKIKKDREFFEEDGSPVKSVTQVQIDEKVKKIITDTDFKEYAFDKELVYKLFSITKEDLDKFIINE